jgi:hypothetical protein
MNGHAVCPFCDRPVMHGGVEFGASFLHGECYNTLQREMDEDLVVIESTLLLENYENGERGEEAA